MAGILFLLGCSGVDKNQDVNQISDIWVAVGMGEKDLSVGTDGDPTSLPQLEIMVSEMKYKGSDGCNQLMGGLIELNEHSIRFGLAAGTMMICPEMEITDLFNRTLPEVRSWEIKNNQLHLFDEKGAELMQLKKLD